MAKVKVTKKDIQQVAKLVSPESRAVREYLRNDIRDFFKHEAKGANYLLALQLRTELHSLHVCLY
jgi:hypothetical protein